MRSLIIGLGVSLLAGAAAAQDKPVLHVYTYDSFVSDWGPGPAIETNFEAICDCDLELTGAGDGAALLARVQLEGERSKADIVLGLDTNLTARAASTGLFAEHGQSPQLDVPMAWEDRFFLPYDWGYFAFVYGETVSNPPASLAALAESDLKIIIQDPRSSTPGLGLMYWAQTVFGDDAQAFWADLSDNIVTVTKGWDEAYGLFLEGEADMVLSYTTSPSYHIIAEGDTTKQAAVFAEGNYMQIEVAGKLAGTDHPELADKFLEFMLSEGFQAVIPTTNWMFPAVIPEGGLPEGFATPLGPDQSLILSASDAEAVRDDALAAWQAGLSQ